MAHQYEKLVNINDKWCEERDAAVSISITLKYELAEVKAERDAAVADIEKLMREVGLQCWEACEFCGMYDDDECIRNQPKGKCKAKWRGVKEGADER